MEIKTIRVKEKAHKELSELAKSHGMNIGEFTEEMVNYFKRTKSDPCQKEDTVTSIKEVKKEVNRLIGFIKTNEKEHLKPILDSLEVTRRNLNNNVQKLDKIEVLENHIRPIYSQTKRIDDDRVSLNNSVDSIVHNQLEFGKVLENNIKNVMKQNHQIQVRFNVLKKLLIWLREFEEGFEKSVGGIYGYKKEDMNQQLSQLKQIVEQI